MTIAGAALGFLVGLVLGALGADGAILTVPIFVYLLGFEAKQAIATALGVLALISLAGAAGEGRAGNVRIRVGLVFGLVGMVGAFGGARASAFLSGSLQLTLFAAVVLAAAFFLFRGAGPGLARFRLQRVDDPAWRPNLGLMGLAGLGVGALSGLTGAGAGFLVVPALALLGRLTMQEAVGTSLLVIGLSAAAGCAGYLGQLAVPWVLLALFTAAAIVGIMAGARLAGGITPEAARRAFAIFLLIVGVAILYTNRSAFVSEGTAAPASEGRLETGG